MNKVRRGMKASLIVFVVCGTSAREGGGEQDMRGRFEEYEAWIVAS